MGEVPFLSIVVPAYNEAERLPRTLTETLAFLTLQPYTSELIVVDDGSKDQTADVVRRLVEQAPERLRLVQNPGNRGKGFSVRNGVLHARGQIVLFFDADLSTPLTEVTKVIDPIVEDRYDIVIGSRANPKGRTLVRTMASKAFGLVRRAISGLDLDDTQCGFKAFRRQAALSIFPLQTANGFSFDVELLVIAKYQGWRTLETPVEWAHQEGSKVNVVKHAVSMASDLLRFRLREVTRASVRVTSSSAVRVLAAEGRQFDCFLHDVSLGGAFLQTEQAMAAGEILSVLLPSPDGRLHELPAEVVRVEPGPAARPHAGIGVRFVRVEPSAGTALQQFLNTNGLRATRA